MIVNFLTNNQISPATLSALHSLQEISGSEVTFTPTELPFYAPSSGQWASAWKLLDPSGIDMKEISFLEELGFAVPRHDNDKWLVASDIVLLLYGNNDQIETESTPIFAIDYLQSQPPETAIRKMGKLFATRVLPMFNNAVKRYNDNPGSKLNPNRIQEFKEIIRSIEYFVRELNTLIPSTE